MERLAADAEGRLSELPRKAYQYWLSLTQSDGALPGRQHINPVEIPALLPHLWLIDVDTDPPAYRFRLVGTAVVEAMHQEMTGLTLDDLLEGKALRETRSRLDEIVETHRPQWQVGLPLVNPDKRFGVTERLDLPLAADGETVDMLFSITVFHSRSKLLEMPNLAMPALAFEQ